jgi:outer membrane protein TolC
MKHHSRSWPAGLLLSLLLTGFLFVLPFRSVAQEEGEKETVPTPRVRSLTLEEVLRMGVDASPKLWSQRYVIDAAEAQLKQAQAGRYPRMEYLQILGIVNQARGDIFYSPDARTDLLNGLGPFTRLELIVNQPLYTFGRLRAHIDAAEHGMEAKQASLDRFRLELVKTLKELYYSLQLNEDLYDLVSETEEQFTKAVERAEELLNDEKGTLTQQDLLKLRYGLNRSSGQLVELRKGRHLVHAALKRLLYLPEGEDFTVTEKRLRPVEIELKSLEFYQETATRVRPEWKELDQGIQARQAELKAEQRGYFPDLFVSGIFRYSVAPNRDEQENPFAVEDFNYLNGGLFLGCRLALDFGLPQRIAEKRAELFTLMQDKRDAVSGMLLEVEKAYRDVVEKQESLDFSRKSRKDGRALAALSAAGFQMGLGEAKDVFEAFGIYTEAAAKYYLAVKDFNVSVAELDRVTGKDFLEKP